jgi:hypothetical protein
MTANPEQASSLTFTAEMDALGVPEGYGVWSEAGGSVSGLELTVFRDAIAAQVRARTTEAPDKSASYQPAEDLSEDVREKLIRAHGIGVTVADILLDEHKIGDQA